MHNCEAECEITTDHLGRCINEAINGWINEYDCTTYFQASACTNLIMFVSADVVYIRRELIVVCIVDFESLRIKTTMEEGDDFIRETIKIYQ
ncbi:hypothetical protein D9M71_638620 [compost metagenome]